jgi:hypothetical protein
VTSHSPGPDAIDVPRLSVAEMQRLVAAHVSLPSRVGHLLLLIGSLIMAVAMGSLWATEPSLPARTHAAFALIVSIALAWATFATWVLARRRVLFGRDRVLAARMGLAFSMVGAIGMSGLAYWGAVGKAAYLGALVHLLLCGIAALLLVKARRRVEALVRRRRELEAKGSIS